MKNKARKFCNGALIAFSLVIALFLALFFTRETWAELLIKNRASHYLRLPKDIDTVEVFTLEDNPNGNSYGFAGDVDSPVGTVGHKTLTENDAKKIANLWGQFPIGRKFQAMCFEPVYGLQFKRKGNVYFQTSVCWHCAAFTVSVPFVGTEQYGFNSKSDGAQELLTMLEGYLPLRASGTTNSTSIH